MPLTAEHSRILEGFRIYIAQALTSVASRPSGERAARHGTTCSYHALSILCPSRVRAMSMPCPCRVHAVSMLCRAVAQLATLVSVCAIF